MAEAYPLEWPEGWPRTKDVDRKWSLAGGRARNKGWNAALAELHDELRRLGATNVVLSTNMPLRRDGLPYANASAKRIDDTGCAVYFMLNDRAMVMAQDSYELLIDNMRSLRLAINHLRGLNRHGGGHMMERAFSGFEALPAPSAADAWWNVLGVQRDTTVAEAKSAFRAMSFKHHPDRPGGSTDHMARLNQAWRQAQAELVP